MELIEIYESLCDLTRLRLVHVLTEGPLCVCHFQEVLREPQVKISKHLAYLRARGLVRVERQGNWMIYDLPAKKTPEFAANLRCLVQCASGHPKLTQDLARLKRLALKPPAGAGCGCAPIQRPAPRIRSQKTAAAA